MSEGRHEEPQSARGWHSELGFGDGWASARGSQAATVHWVVYRTRVHEEHWIAFYSGDEEMGSCEEEGCLRRVVGRPIVMAGAVKRRR